jgi:hypothetical protein
MTEYKFVDLKQKHVEKFNEGVPTVDASKPAIFHGAIVRAAANAGWFDPPLKAEEVDDMSPRLVNNLAMQITKLYGEAMAISPE